MSKLGFLGIRGIRSYSNYGENDDELEPKVLDFTRSPVTLILGENGTGKTVRLTFDVKFCGGYPGVPTGSKTFGSLFRRLLKA